MIWDVPHRRGAGFPLRILRPVGVHSILTTLCHEGCLAPRSLLEQLDAANRKDAPLVGERDLSEVRRSTLSYLRSARLIERCNPGRRGAHTEYKTTELGAGLIGALGPLREWALRDFDFVVAATRVRLELPPLTEPAPLHLRTGRVAEGMAVSVLGGLWADTMMIFVDSSGPRGISPGRLEETVNAAIDATSGENRVVRHLHGHTMHRTLARLVAKGLLDKRVEPPRVFYLLTSHGRGLMDAWWQVAETWGIRHDAELFEIMRYSGWFAKPES